MYANTPAIALSQPDATHIALAGASTELEVFAEPNHSKCGEPGFIYMGAIQAGGSGMPPCPGGWPAPQVIYARVP